MPVYGRTIEDDIVHTMYVHRLYMQEPHKRGHTYMLYILHSIHFSLLIGWYIIIILFFIYKYNKYDTMTMYVSSTEHI